VDLRRAEPGHARGTAMNTDLRAISVIVPAHNEAQYLGACLDSLRVAAAHPRLAGVLVNVVVVLDNCDDDSLPIALSAGATCLELKARNVGAARDAGARLALAQGPTGWPLPTRTRWFRQIGWLPNITWLNAMNVTPFVVSSMSMTGQTIPWRFVPNTTRATPTAMAIDISMALTWR